MDLGRYQEKLPIVWQWIEATLRDAAWQARAVTSFSFARLPQFYSEELLKTTKVVVVDRIPMPPLGSIGLVEFEAFETQPMDGITYLDTYFLRSGTEGDESIHFHELVHVIQWRTVGPERFLLAYASGLATNGYRNSPLEAMAFSRQTRFDNKEPAYSVESLVRDATLGIVR